MTATVVYKIGDKVGMVHSVQGVLLNLTIDSIQPQNMVVVLQSIDMWKNGDGLLSKTWTTPVERLFKR